MRQAATRSTLPTWLLMTKVGGSVKEAEKDPYDAIQALTHDRLAFHQQDQVSGTVSEQIAVRTFDELTSEKG